MNPIHLFHNNNNNKLIIIYLLLAFSKYFGAKSVHYFGFLISSANKVKTQLVNHVSLEPCTCIVKGHVINRDGWLLNVEISNNWIINLTTT
jgi:hypothetical protein